MIKQNNLNIIDGNYNPFSNEGDIYPFPLSTEEMEEKGYLSMEHKVDIENGYYAFIYHKHDINYCKKK